MGLSRVECIAAAIFSSVLSSVATLFKVQGVDSVPPLLAASIGVLFGGLLTFTYLLVRRNVPSLEVLRSVWKPLAILILCRPIISNILFTIGLCYSTGIKAVFLTKMEPYLVIFWVWLLDGKRPSPQHLTLLIVHIGGAMLLSAGDTMTLASLHWGDLIIFSAVVMAALSYRYAPQLTRTLAPMQASCVVELSGGLLTLPLALAFSPLEWNAELAAGWGYVGVHAVLFYVFALSLWYASLQNLDGWLSSALRSIGPLIAAPIAWIAFGETLNGIQICGAVVVLATSCLITKK